MSLLVSKLYRPKRAYFTAKNGQTDINECTPFNFLPLWTNLLKQDPVESMTARLEPGNIFWGQYPLSTVSRKSSKYDPETMWRGPVWININYLFIEAFRVLGKHDQASRLKEATLTLVNRGPGMFEYYNPETGLPPEKAAPAFGWTAALFIDLLLQPD
jgi:glycogen debranching enzyme